LKKYMWALRGLPENECNKMNLYQLMFSENKKVNNAAFKAPEDVAAIASALGFRRLDINVRYRAFSDKSKLIEGYYYIKSILQCLLVLMKVKKNSVVLIQTPTGGGFVRNYMLKNLRKRKNIKFISFFHDVEKLRGIQVNDAEEYFFNFLLSISDGIVVHNSRMKEWFMKKEGIDDSRIISLGIFDYLAAPVSRNRRLGKQVIIAGNLDPKKVRYLSGLKELDTDFLLYGSNYDESVSGENISYMGSFPPEELPSVLSDGFGLIWDGECVETCSGTFGNYLRYNNPHKLSLYLASGLPVFIWKEAAEAEFVEENGVGYAVSSLSDIAPILNEITEEKYRELCHRVETVSARLTSGFYTKCALATALERVIR